MPFGYFIRSDPTPIKLRFDISKPIQVVNPGDVIYVDYATYKDVVGFKFVGWTPPLKAGEVSQDPKHPTKVYDGEEIDVVAVQAKKQAPHKIFLENLKKEEKTVVTYVEDTEESKVKPPELPAKNITENDMNNDALIAYLKKFSQKNWFVMKKEKAIEYLERLRVDFSDVPNNKNELIKKLKKFIEDN
jgi:hypothetical protein